MEDITEIKQLRTRVYIDGYNLYYGCLKGTPYKWLDLICLFEKHILPSVLVKYNNKPAHIQLLPQAIKFFTAKILEKASKSVDSVSSQARYHTALRKMYDGTIEIIEGYYSLTESKAKIVDPENPKKWARDCEDILVWKMEEKQSDVNLALQAYHDAITNQVDHVVIVTNDTDIAPALKMIKDHTEVIIGLVIPTNNHERVPNSELVSLSDWTRTLIKQEELAASQLPRVIIKGKTPTIKPESWYERPDLLEKILLLAIPIVGSRAKAFKWMEEVNPYLSNKAPIDLIGNDEDAELIVDYINKYVDREKIDSSKILLKT